MIMACASIDNYFYSSKTKKPEDFFSDESFLNFEKKSTVPSFLSTPSPFAAKPPSQLLQFPGTLPDKAKDDTASKHLIFPTPNFTVDLPNDTKKDAELQKKHILKKVDAYNMEKLEQTLFTCNPKERLQARHTKDSEWESGDLFAELDTSKLLRQAYSKQNEPIEAKLKEKKEERKEEPSEPVKESTPEIESPIVVAEPNVSILELQSQMSKPSTTLQSLELDMKNEYEAMNLEIALAEDRVVIDANLPTTQPDAPLELSVDVPTSESATPVSTATEIVSDVGTEATNVSSSTVANPADEKDIDIDAFGDDLTPVTFDPLSPAASTSNPLAPVSQPLQPEQKVAEPTVIVSSPVEPEPISEPVATKNDFENFFSSTATPAKSSSETSQRATNHSFSFDDDLFSEKKPTAGSKPSASALGDDFFGASSTASTPSTAKRKTVVKQDFSSDEDDFFSKGASAGKSPAPSRANTYDDDDFFS